MTTPSTNAISTPATTRTANSIIGTLHPAGTGGIEPHYTGRRPAFDGLCRAAGAAALTACLAVAAASIAFAADGGATKAITPDPLRYVSPSRPYRTEHTALDLDVDVEHQRIAGHVSHTVRSLRDGLAQITFNCVGLTVDSVTVDGARTRFDYPVEDGSSTSWIWFADEAVADDHLVIHLPTPLARDARAVVTVHYRGEPKIGLYWIQPEKGIAEKRYEVWSQGEGEDNRYWIPCNDYPNEKATFEGRFRVPKGYTAISNGELVSTTDVGGRSEFYWKLDQPQVSYLIMLAVARYKIYEQKAGSVPLWYVVPPGTDDATILRGYGLTPDMVEFYAKTIGIGYPYAKYAQISVQDFIYGGMENTSATVMNMRTLYDERTAPTRNEQSLVAHELAHMWWGDMLTCREWSHMWLNEGFATYYAYLYKEHHEGDDAFRYQMRAAHLDVIKADQTDPRPMVVDFFNRTDARNNSLVYVKGASVLHMLRMLLGDALYHETIRHYGEAHKFDVVETQDLMRAVKDVTGENFDWFFEQWVFLAGHPDFKVTKSWDDSASVLHLKVEQTQKAEGLVPVFRVPVDVEIAWDGGSTVHRVTVEQASQDFYFQVPSEPRMVVFDKGDWILKTLDFPKQTGELVYEIDHGDYTTRLRAVDALAAKGTDERTVPALRGVLLADGHYGLRRQAALALGTIGTEPAMAAIIEGSKAADGLVRLACVEALGGFYGDRTAASCLKNVIEKDFAYGVRAEAVTSLVKTRVPDAASVCAKALAQESDRSVVRNAALNGLADLGDPSAIASIKPYCGPGNRREHRHIAIAAYAKLAKDLEQDVDRRKAAEFLEPMLDDWYLRTREALIDALATIASPSSTTALRRVASDDPLAAVRTRARKAADRIDALAAEVREKTDQSATIEDLKRRVAELEKELESTRAEHATPAGHE